MFELVRLTENALQGVRKTSESSPRVSVLDVLAIFLAGRRRSASTMAWMRLKERYPDVTKHIGKYKFPGQGQRPTPVASAQDIMQIIMVLGGTAAAASRRETADLLVRYIHGNAFKSIEKWSEGLSKHPPPILSSAAVWDSILSSPCSSSCA